jgi:hypothetical protein
LKLKIAEEAHHGNQSECQILLCAFCFSFAPLRETDFTQRREGKTEGAKKAGRGFETYS